MTLHLNFLLCLKQPQFNGIGMHKSPKVTQNDTRVHRCRGVTQIREGNKCHRSIAWRQSGPRTSEEPFKMACAYFPVFVRAFQTGDARAPCVAPSPWCLESCKNRRDRAQSKHARALGSHGNGVPQWDEQQTDEDSASLGCHDVTSGRAGIQGQRTQTSSPALASTADLGLSESGSGSASASTGKDHLSSTPRLTKSARTAVSPTSLTKL